MSVRGVNQPPSRPSQRAWFEPTFSAHQLCGSLERILGYTFLICWITLPADLKNWNFKKKNKKGFGVPVAKKCKLQATRWLLKHCNFLD